MTNDKSLFGLADSPFSPRTVLSIAALRGLLYLDALGRGIVRLSEKISLVGGFVLMSAVYVTVMPMTFVIGLLSPASRHNPPGLAFPLPDPEKSQAKLGRLY